MSHFSVMIIGSNPEKQLDPYWELDLTPEDAAKDYRSEFADCTSEVDEDWENGKKEVVRMPDGRVLSIYDNEFRNTEQNLFSSGDRYVVPEGLKAEEVPTKEYATAIGLTKEEWAADWHGYDTFEGKYGYWHNPKAKWDWHKLGGRWSGYFKAKEGADYIRGESGVMGSCRTKDKGYADQLLKEDIDLEGMYYDAMQEAAEQYNKFEEVTKGLTVPPTWEEVRVMFPDMVDQARKAYHGYAFIQALQKADMMPWYGEVLDVYFVNQGGREKYIENSKCKCLIPFAFLMNGEWYEKGKMGWWGIVSDEKLQYDWSAKFLQLWEELPDDILISMYDLHI